MRSSRSFHRLARRLRRAAGWIACAAAAALLPAAGVAGAPEPPSEAATVYTRAEVRSFFEEADGRPFVRLKLLPRVHAFVIVQVLTAPRRPLSCCGADFSSSLRGMK